MGREEDELGGREEEVEHKLGEEVRMAKMMAKTMMMMGKMMARRW